MNLGIIADGNRRWAKRENLPAHAGHQKGFDVITTEVLEACLENTNCTALTVYGFSTENWKRSPLEIANLMKIYSQMCDTWEKLFKKNPVQLKWCGRRDRINFILKNKLEKIEKQTENIPEISGKPVFTLYLCLDYGGQDEILRAVELAQKHSEISGKLENFEKYLEVPPLDLIIRTGGEQRLSNFCIWQAAYAEFFFLQKFLPELKKNDIQKILEDFSERDRRKGK